MYIKKYPFIRDVRIHGAGAGIEFITKDNIPDSNIVKKIERSMLKKQILVYAGGEKGNVLMLIPPLIISLNNLKKSIEILLNEINLLYSFKEI